MKQRYKKLLVALLMIASCSYSHGKKKAAENLIFDKELTSQTPLLEDRNLEITLYFIDNSTLLSSDCINTIIKETAEELKEIGEEKYTINGYTNIIENERNATKRSTRKTTWLSHQLKIVGLDAELATGGKGYSEPEIKNPQFNWQNDLNSCVKITIE